MCLWRSEHRVANVLCLQASPVAFIFPQIAHADKESAKFSLVLAVVSGDAGFFPGFSKLLLPRRFL